MTLPTEPSLQKLQFYVTTPYTCGYLPKKMAQSLIATPQHLISADIYSGLITQGFRRSGNLPIGRIAKLAAPVLQCA